jgi:hypothetical protein
MCDRPARRARSPWRGRVGRPCDTAPHPHFLNGLRVDRSPVPLWSGAARKGCAGAPGPTSRRPSRVSRAAAVRVAVPATSSDRSRTPGPSGRCATGPRRRHPVIFVPLTVRRQFSTARSPPPEARGAPRADPGRRGGGCRPAGTTALAESGLERVGPRICGYRGPRPEPVVMRGDSACSPHTLGARLRTTRHRPGSPCMQGRSRACSDSSVDDDGGEDPACGMRP